MLAAAAAAAAGSARLCTRRPRAAWVAAGPHAAELAERSQRRGKKYEISFGTKRRSTQGVPKRAGLLGLKVGMMPGWDEVYGSQYPLTVVAIENCEVTQVKTPEKEGFYALQVGALDAKPKHLRATVRGHLQAQGASLKRHLAEFRVSEEGVMPVGTKITARHFVPGQYVDVQGVTQGKGFQGVMKRWGFKGQSASHGTTKAHRSPGSIGGSQDPGRVLKGKKMPGRMGNKTRTVQNLVVFRVDTERNLLYLRGHVPGKAGGLLRITDAKKKPFTLVNGEDYERPFPTFKPDPDAEPEPAVLNSPPPERNPLALT